MNYIILTAMRVYMCVCIVGVCHVYVCVCRGGGGGGGSGVCGYDVTLHAVSCSKVTMYKLLAG